MHTICISIPSLNEQWSFAPISTKQQKNICKVILEIREDYSHFILTINNILYKNISPLYRDKFYTLNLIDKLVILLHLRCVSIGTEIELQLQKDNKQYNYTYKLFDVLDQIINHFHDYSISVFEQGDIKIICSIPQILEERNLIEAAKKQNLLYSDLLPHFIKSISIKNIEINYLNLSIEDKNAVINTLPALLLEKIVSAVQYINQHFNKILLHSVIDMQVKFNFIGNIYVDFIKFIFDYNLYNIYQEIYVLTKHGNLSAEYVETLTSMERELYISFIKQENQPTSEQSSSTSIPVPLPANDPLQDLDIYKQTVGG